MGTSENSWVSDTPPENPNLQGLGFPSSPPSPSDHESLLQQFQNVGLEENLSNGNVNSNFHCEDNGNLEVHEQGNESGRSEHPVRPYAEDCSFFIRTGSCKFGLNCRFNHPLRKGSNNQAGREKDKEVHEDAEQIECKYYLTAGGCKYGNSCRYIHSKEKTQMTQTLDLNFLGLPIRVGEKECPFYMRNGSCGYGANCRFHHPNPTVGGGAASPNLYNGMPNGGPVGGRNHPLASHSTESSPLHLLGSSQPPVAMWPPHMMANQTVPFLDNRSPYMPPMHSRPEMTHPNPEWNGYQGFMYAQERTRPLNPGPNMGNPMKASTHHQAQNGSGDFPERPGQPECGYFMKTGDCKFKSACRYHHPTNGPQQIPSSVLTDNGLPSRPDKRICWHYERNGTCKYGRTCLFDHPVNHGSHQPLLVRSGQEPAWQE